MPGKMRLEVREEIVVEIVEGYEIVATPPCPKVLEPARLVADEEREDGSLILAEAAEKDG
jgi:hypothetical protein